MKEDFQPANDLVGNELQIGSPANQGFARWDEPFAAPSILEQVAHALPMQDEGSEQLTATRILHESFDQGKNPGIAVRRLDAEQDFMAKSTRKEIENLYGGNTLDGGMEMNEIASQGGSGSRCYSHHRPLLGEAPYFKPMEHNGPLYGYPKYEELNEARKFGQAFAPEQSAMLPAIEKQLERRAAMLSSAGARELPTRRYAFTIENARAL